MRFVIFQVNANFLIIQLKNIFTQDNWQCPFMTSKSLCSPSENLSKTSNFHYILLVFTGVEVCNITNKNQSPSNLEKYQYFNTIHLISFLHFQKNGGTLHRKRFSKHPLFTTFSLFLTVIEVCNILNKCKLPNKSANNIFSTQDNLYPSFI